MLARGGVGRVCNLRVRVLRMVTLEVLIRELEAGLHVCVARVEEGSEELDIRLLTVVLVREETNAV